MPSINLTIEDAKKKLVLDHWDKFPMGIRLPNEMWNKIKPFYKKTKHVREAVTSSLNNTYMKLRRETK